MITKNFINNDNDDDILIRNITFFILIEKRSFEFNFLVVTSGTA